MISETATFCSGVSSADVLKISSPLSVALRAFVRIPGVFSSLPLILIDQIRYGVQLLLGDRWFRVWAYRRGRWGLSRAYTHHAALGVSETNSSAFIAFYMYMGKFSRRTCRRHLRQTPSVDAWLYALAALAGAMIGTIVGLRWLSQKTMCYLLAAILCAAGIQLLVF